MGWTFYNLASLPNPNDLVWCKWPQREDGILPGRIVRPVLVRVSKILAHPTFGQYGALIVSYCSGELHRDRFGETDLILEDAEAKALGLHKATRCSMDLSDRKQLPWCEEYFVPQPHVLNQGLLIGSLNADQIKRMDACLVKRGYKR